MVVCDSQEAFNVGEFNATSSVEKDKIFVACDALAHASCNGSVGPKWDEKNWVKSAFSNHRHFHTRRSHRRSYLNAEALNVGTMCSTPLLATLLLLMARGL